jgi:hypothetical protein
MPNHLARQWNEPAVTARPPVTPDGRYIVVRGRLWRRANPALAEAERYALAARLMKARRAVGMALKAGDTPKLTAARAEVNAAKIALGERGPVWWDDGTEDVNRHLARNTQYAGWHQALEDADDDPSIS